MNPVFTMITFSLKDKLKIIFKVIKTKCFVMKTFKMISQNILTVISYISQQNTFFFAKKNYFSSDPINGKPT